MLKIKLPDAWDPAGRRVRFVDGGGRPLTGVECTLNGQPMAELAGGDHSVGAGEGVRPPLRLLARRDGYLDLRTSLPATAWSEQTFELKSASRLTVYVSDTEGVPVSGANVMFIAGGSGVFGGPTQVTGSEGRVLFGAVPGDGSRRLVVAPPEPQIAWMPTDEGSNPAIRGLEPGEQEARIVLAREARPLTSAIVVAQDYSTGKTEPIGRIELLPVGGSQAHTRSPRSILLGNERTQVLAAVTGSYLIWVETVGGKKGVIAVDLSDDPGTVVCPVSGPADVSGVVRFAGGRLPVNCRVVARVAGLPSAGRSPDESVWNSEVGALATPDGVFRLAGLLPTLHDVVVLRPPNAVPATRLDPMSAEAAGGIELEWEPSTSLAIETGPDLWGTEVTAVRIRVYSNSMGAEQLLDLMPGVSGGASVVCPVGAGAFDVQLQVQGDGDEWTELLSRHVVVAEGEQLAVPLR